MTSNIPPLIRVHPAFRDFLDECRKECQAELIENGFPIGKRGISYTNVTFRIQKDQNLRTLIKMGLSNKRKKVFI